MRQSQSQSQSHSFLYPPKQRHPRKISPGLAHGRRLTPCKGKVQKSRGGSVVFSFTPSMAVPQFNLQHQTHRYCNQSKFLSVFRPNTPSHLTVNTNFRFPNSIKPPNIRYECFHFHIPNSGSAKDLSAPNIPKAEVLERWVIFMRSVLPGGSWWNLSDSNEVGSKAREAKPVTVLLALRRIWALVADDRWVIYAALVSLTIVA
ncbi:unnamed protein product [Camellia sinensis]